MPNGFIKGLVYQLPANEILPTNFSLCRVNIVNFLPGVSEGDRVDLAYFVFAGSMLSVSLVEE